MSALDPPLDLDAAATTRPAPEVIDAMLPWLREGAGNARSIHAGGAAARRALEEARAEVAALVGGGFEADEVHFASGATEALHLGIRGISRQRAASLARASRGALPALRIVTTPLEHASCRGAVREAAREASGEAWARAEAVFAGGGRGGRFDPQLLLAEVDASTLLVAAIAVQNETGLLQPVGALGPPLRAQGVPLVVDATQAIGRTRQALPRDAVDALVISGHKVHGPQGIGALVLRRGVGCRPLLSTDPASEGGLRAGTPPVALAAGLGAACRLARARLATDAPEVLSAARDALEARVLALVPGAARNGDGERAPGISSLRFEGIDGEALVRELSRRGVHASTGAACASSSREPSPALLASGLSPAEARGSLRLSLSFDADLSRLDAAAQEIARTVALLRRVRSDSGSASQ